MIKSVTAINPQGERLTLELRNPIKSGIAVRDISGLGPPQAQVTMSKVSNLDGVRKSSATVGGRNIVLKLGLLNLPTVEEVRLKTYQFFPIKQLVQLIIESDTRTVWVEGTVETNTPTIFDPETTSQVSIVTEEAYLLDASAKRVAGEKFFSTQPLFEFPFVNALGAKSLEFGRVVTELEKDVLYPGDAEVGVRVTIDFLGNVENPVVFKPLETQALRLDSAVVRALTGTGFVSGDRVIVNTRVGQKSAQLYRNGVYTNIMNALGRRVDWLTFRRGINRLKYSATSGVENLQIQIESDILYEGI